MEWKQFSKINISSNISLFQNLIQTICIAVSSSFSWRSLFFHISKTQYQWLQNPLLRILINITTSSGNFLSIIKPFRSIGSEENLNFITKLDYIIPCENTFSFSLRFNARNYAYNYTVKFSNNVES